MPAHDRHQGNQDQVYQTDGQEVFPFEIEQLVDPQTREGPAKPHDQEYEEESFSKEPNTAGDPVHDNIELCPAANMKGHPAT